MSKIIDDVKYVGSIAAEYVAEVAKFGYYIFGDAIFGYPYSPFDNKQREINRRY